MASVGRSAIEFVRGVWGAVFAIAAAIADPLDVGKMIGVTDPSAQWILGETAMRVLFLMIGVGWAFIWYHNARKRMDADVRDPTMPLHRACRWIARDSVWASGYGWSDEEWTHRVEAEIFSKWQLGRIKLMGVEKGTPSGSFGYLPEEMKGASKFESAKLATNEPPTHVWDYVDVKSGRSPTCFLQVRLDPAEIRRVWPRRSWLDRLKGNSPIERLGGYREIFDNQDAWYSENYEHFHEPLDWILLNAR